MTPAALKAWREARGLSVRELARLLQVSHPTVMRWEAGTTRLHPFLEARLAVLEAGLAAAATGTRGGIRSSGTLVRSRRRRAGRSA